MNTVFTILLFWWISTVLLFTMNIWPFRNYSFLDRKIRASNLISDLALQVLNLGQTSGLGLPVVEPFSVLGIKAGSVLSGDLIDKPLATNQVLTFDGESLVWRSLKPQTLNLVPDSNVVIGSTNRRETPRQPTGVMALATNGDATIRPLSVTTNAFASMSVQNRHWQETNSSNGLTLVTNSVRVAEWHDSLSLLSARNVDPELSPPTLNQVAPFINHAFAVSLTRDGQEIRLLEYGRVSGDASALLGVLVRGSDSDLVDFMIPSLAPGLDSYDWAIEVHMCRTHRTSGTVWVVSTRGSVKQVSMFELGSDLEDTMEIETLSFSSSTPRSVECTFSEAKIFG